MRTPSTLALLLPLTVLMAADLPEIPAQPIGVKKEQLFSDDFERTDLGTWKQVVPAYVVEGGVLKGTQTRFSTPAADGKPEVKPHAAVAGKDVPTGDSIVACRFRLASATALSVEFDDRAYQGSHYGHICRVIITPRNVVLRDEKEGSMRNDIYAMKDPGQKAEKARLLAGRQATFPHPLEPGAWHSLVLETVGDAMRVTIDDKPVAYLKSPGIAHPTKSRIELGCAGREGFFDDFMVWSAEPAK